MIKKIVTTLTLVLFVVALGSATDKTSKSPKPIADDGNGGIAISTQKTQSTNAVAPVLIGKMWNGYSSQSPYTNLISYDPYSGLIAIVKRTDRTGAGSGRIAYQVSEDQGVNWSPQLGPLNKSPFNFGRHPNIVISNPLKSTSNLNAQILVAENELVSGAFRDVIYLHDSLTGALINYYHDSSNAFVYAGAVDQNTGKAYWPIASGLTNDGSISWTNDKGKTYTKKIVVPSAEVHSDDSKLVEVGVNGTVWYVMRGKYFGIDTVNYIFRIQWSTDGGNVWSAAKYFKHSDAGKHGNAYEWDLISDRYDQLHLAVVLTDTVATPGTRKYELYDVVIPKTGTATYNKVANINRNGHVIPRSASLQTLNEPEYSRTLNGNSLVLKWVDTKTAAVTDTLNDIFMSHKTNAAVWAAPANKSNSVAINEYFSNSATIMNTNGQVYLYYTDWPLTDTDETNLWFLPEATVILNVAPVNNTVPSNFTLEQNYPNPFNPTTNINYNVPVQGNVELSIYNMLGQHVTTLVNEQHGVGAYSTTWNGKDANGLSVSSGMYFYKMRAGQFESVKKMLLMK